LQSAQNVQSWRIEDRWLKEVAKRWIVASKLIGWMDANVEIWKVEDSEELEVEVVPHSLGDVCSCSRSSSNVKFLLVKWNR